MMDLSILIVNYKSSRYLKKCLESVISLHLDISFEIIVIDNFSSDDGLLSIKNEFKDVVFIELNENRGFARGNNAGIRKSRGRAVMLLNPDTIVNSGAIQTLFDSLMQSEEIGIVGARIFYPDGSLQSKLLPKKLPNLFYLFSEMFYLDKIFPNAYFGNNFDYEKEQEVEQVCGACLMIKRKIIDAIGLMDERFFLYFDEADWCLRALRQGYKVHYVPKATIVHFEGKSSEESKKSMVDNYYKTQLYFFRKYYGIAKTLTLYLINLIGFTFRLIIIPAYLIKYRNNNKVMRHTWALLFHLKINHLTQALKI